MDFVAWGAACVASFALVSARVDAQETPAPAAVSGGVLARDAYLRAVLNANPGIESARQGWRAAQARTRAAGAFADPMLDVGMAPLSIGSSSARFGYEVGIHQELPWFGKRALEREVMNAEAAAAAHDLETTRRELAMTALVLYGQYYVAVRSLEINVEHHALLESMRAAATSQLETGRGSAHDALQAESELAHLEHDAAVLEADRDVAAAQMNALLHRDPAAPLPPPVTELAVPPRHDAREAKQLQQAAVAQRTEISAARSHARAQAAKADAVSRDYYPNFLLSTSYSSMWDMPEHRWMIGVGVSVPLPTDNRAAAIDEARASRAQYESEVERMSDQARAQVYVALRRLQETQQILQLYETRLMPVAREQVDAARTAFIGASTPFIAVVEAEKNLRSVELEQKLAQAECDVRDAELERALGRIPGLRVEEGPR